MVLKIFIEDLLRKFFQMIISEIQVAEIAQVSFEFLGDKLAKEKA
jgi:hypothetical protein